VSPIVDATAFSDHRITELLFGQQRAFRFGALVVAACPGRHAAAILLLEKLRSGSCVRVCGVRDLGFDRSPCFTSVRDVRSLTGTAFTQIRIFPSTLIHLLGPQGRVEPSSGRAHTVQSSRTRTTDSSVRDYLAVVRSILNVSVEFKLSV
jgi:hypothetical protein